jgi:hypothetical protein
LTLVTVRVEVPVVPWPRLRLLGLVERMKSGVVLVEKTAVWTVSGTDAALPFAMVTQTPPETLVCEQPVWNPSVVPAVPAVTL